MSDIGIADTTTPAKAKLPGAIDITTPKIQPGNITSAAPNIPSQAPPNVDGGAASFSDITQSIRDLVAAKTSELSASATAFKANTSVDASAAAQLSGIQTKSLQAFDNIQKANSLPGGADGKLAHIIGLFDSDYNVAHQTLAVKENELRSNQISATAQALKEQNNQLPVLMGKISEASKVIFDAQKDANQLAISGATLEDARSRTRQEAIRIELEQGKAAREKKMFPLQMQEAELNVAKAQLALKKGQRDDYEESMTTAMSHLPIAELQARLQAAQTSGAPVVTFGTGKIDPKTKQAETLDVPISIVQAGLAKNIQIETAANTAVATDLSNRLQIIPNATGLVNTLNAASSFDQRATGVTVQLGAVMKNLDPNNPASVQQTGLLLKPLVEQRDKIYKEQADKFSTPEAKAAVVSYGSTGKFDSEGAGAVVAATGGNPSLANPNHSKFGYAWLALNTAIATEIGRQHAGGSGIAFNSGNINSTDASALIASLQAQSGGKEKIAAITNNIMADPTKTKDISIKIQNKLRVDTMNNTLHLLSSQKDAPAIWGNVLAHPEQYNNKDGQFDPDIMFNQFEQAKVQSGGKLDYTTTFLAGLRAYGTSADTTPAADPSYTMQDHALVTRLFGENPVNRVASDLHWQLRQRAQEARRQMMERIKQDITGQTQMEAVKQASIINPNFQQSLPPFISPNDPEFANKVQKHTGLDLNSVPSATGTGLTALQIKAMFPGGYQ